MKFWEINTHYSNNVAVYDESLGCTFTYLELFEFVDFVKTSVYSSEKKLALVLTNNSFISISLYLACLSLGHAILFLDAESSVEIIESTIKNYLPDYILSPKKIKSLNTETMIPFFNRDLSFEINKIGNKQNLAIFPELDLLLSTSGSTGSSKYVKLTKKNILSNASSIVEYLKIDSNQRAITALPMHYSFGLSIINTHLLAGASVVCTNKSIVQKNFWDIFKSNNCTTFSGVPYTFQILEKFRINDISLPSLQYFTQAGGHLNVETKRYFLNYAKTRKKCFIVMYGQTEATARISYVPFEFLEEKLDSIGIPIPGGSLKIYDDSNEIQESDKIGELVYSGKNVMLGYATGRNSLSSGDELKGVLKTGDLGRKDIDNFYFISGRMKRFLKVFGNRINLDDLERILESRYSVPFAVTGHDDLVCILAENISDEKEIVQFLSQKIKIHFTAIRCKSTNKLPLSPNGKKDYNLIKEFF